jgi:glycosyl transferase family 25
MSDKIDKIIYINLKKRTDRRQQIEQDLNAYGLSYERFDAIETPGFGALGCGLSHLSVLKLAKEKQYKNVLILEDDFTFLVPKETVEDQLRQFFDLHLDYDVCMLSYNLIRSQATQYTVINKILEVQTASGYIVNCKYYDKLINLYEWAMPILQETKQEPVYSCDQIWKMYQPDDNWYAFNLRIGQQRPGYSDTGEFYVNNTC